MKRFSKILTVLLAIVAIVCAFTVVALAEETAAPLSSDYKKDGKIWYEHDDGKILSYDRNAWATVQTQDNGNRYIVIQDAPEGYYESLSDTSGSKKNWTNPQWDIGPSATGNIVDYPYFMIEFDITTLNGSYDGFTYNPRIYGRYVSKVDENGKKTYTNQNTFIGTTYFNSIGLSTEAYDWSHVSLVYEYKGEGKFVVHRYVNGALVNSVDGDNISGKEMFSADKGDLKNAIISSGKFYPAQKSDVCMDNLNFTFFPNGYESAEEDADVRISKMANYNFKNGVGYEFPYKFTVATVTDNKTGEVTYFDNYEDAYAATNENTTFKSVYAAEIIDADGNVTYVNEEDLEKVFSTAAKGSTIKLHQDFFATKNAISGGAFNVTKNLTLDVNGYNFGSVYTTTTKYEATLGEDGNYVKGDAIADSTTTTGATGYLFYQNSKGFTFTIKSSRPGATISSLGINQEEWVCGDEVVNKVVTKYYGRGLFSLYPSSATYNILGENITFYCQTLFYGEHGSNDAKLSVNIDGGTFYTFFNSDGKVGEGLLAIRRGGNHTVKNATFYANNHPVVKSGWDQYTTITFDNCNFYDGSIYGTGVTNVYYFNNCRFAGGGISGGSTAAAYLGENTYVTNKNSFDVGKGLIIVPDKSVSYSYRPVSSLNYTYDEASGKFVASFVFAEAVTGTYSYTTDDITKYENVAIDDARLSFIFTNNFDMMFYLPVDAEYTYADKTVGRYTKQSDTVFIDGKEYYAYKRAMTTSGASDTAPATVTFTKDGVSYTQTFYTDALLYAELVLGGETVDVEAKAVANMVRFIKEARTLAGVSVSDRFAKIEALYTLDGYKADTEYDALGVDYSGLTGVGMSFAVRGSNASYLVDLPVATFANAVNATVTITFEDGTAAKLTSTKNYEKTHYYWYTTNKMHISEMLDKTITVSVTVPATDGGADTVLTGTYSVGAYVQATGNTFAKAMIEFGVAAKEYRAYLEEKYPG